jgi:hypothetical protein
VYEAVPLGFEDRQQFSPNAMVAVSIAAAMAWGTIATAGAATALLALAVRRGGPAGEGL